MSDENTPADDAVTVDAATTKPVEENIKSRATWTRLLFIVICCILVSIASFVGSFIVIFGFLWLLFTGEVNAQLRQAGQSLASYIYEIIRYLTFNSDERPFPLGGEWPSGDTDG